MAPKQTPRERAQAKALQLLAVRARTREQIRDRLTREGLGQVVDEVLEWLSRLGYIDDAAYAQARARSLLAPGRLGPRLAELRLVAAGVARSQAQEAIAEALLAMPVVSSRFEGRPTDLVDAEVELCRALAQSRLRRVSPDALDDQARARLARFLLGRGFSGRAVASAIGIDDMDQ